MIKVCENYTLNTENIDRIAERTDEICQTEKTVKGNRIQIRLAMEECLLGWQEKFGDGQELVLRTHRFLFRKMLTIQCRSSKQESFNPYSVDESVDSIYGRSIMGYLKVVPEYSFRSGWNMETFRLKKEEPQPLLTLLMVIIIACIVGILGKLFIPAGALDTINTGFLTPTYDKFLDILGCIAGPLIFCSVAWGIYGMGDMSTLNRLGKGVIGHLVGAVFLTTCFSCLGMLFFNVSFNNEAADLSQVSDIYQMLLDMLPGNIIAPLTDGNTLQIIIIAVIVGICLIYLESKTKWVAMAIGQLNSLISFMMELIGKLVPFFVAIVLINLIWSGNISIVGNSWKFLVVLAAGILAIMIVVTIITAFKQRVSPWILVRKVFPAYVIALTTASSAATFGIMTKNCEESMGIHPSMTHFGIPIGFILCKVSTALNSMLVIFYISEMYNVALSPSRIVMAVLIVTATAVATPPIPGGGVIAYTVLFTQMGLPMEGLSIILALDMLTDFVITACDMYCLQLMLINSASRYKQLDENILKGNLQTH